MAEGESEKMSTEGNALIADNVFVWSHLPKDVQHKVLSYLPMQELCRMRCVCKGWRDVIHRHDFRVMYDMVNISQNPCPVICYLESSYPIHLVWSTYDYAGRVWKTRSSFPLPQSSLTALHARIDEFLPLNVNLYSVGGLLCLYRWTFPRGDEFMYEDNLPPRGVGSWTVWHPFRNRWKQLPPNKYKVSGIRPSFVHVFVSDEERKTYKILMAHDPNCRYMDSNEGFSSGGLVTEIYDSATGMWTEAAKYTLRLYKSHADCSGKYLNRRGVLCNGVIYFMADREDYWRDGRNVLLFYDIERDQWQEEVCNDCYPCIFEWDGRLMAIENRGDVVTESFVEWDPATKLWKNTGIEIPWKILGKLLCWSVNFAIVASGNDVAVTGYTASDSSLSLTSFRIAVYKRAENYWRVPPTGAFSNRLRRARVEGLVLHKPILGWAP